jgi:hypothetical protein
VSAKNGFVPRSVAVETIKLDSFYQRDLDNVRVQKMVADWDPRRVTAIVLSARGGSLYCLDGQHRLAAARELGVPSLYAFVFEGLSQTEEADYFYLYQTARKGLTAWDLWKAEVAAQHQDVLNIIRVVNSHGFRIERVAHGIGVIRALRALRRIYKLGGEHLLGDTLDLIARVWKMTDYATEGQVVEGVALFLHSFKGEAIFDQTHMEQLLGKTAPAVYMRAAQTIASERMMATTTPSLIAEAMKRKYNEKVAPDKRLGEVRKGGKKLPVAKASSRRKIEAAAAHA